MSVRSKLGIHTLSSIGTTDGPFSGPFSGGVHFTLTAAFSIMAFFLGSVGDCALSGFAEGFSWLRELSSQGDVVRSFSNELFQIENLRGVLVNLVVYRSRALVQFNVVHEPTSGSKFAIFELPVVLLRGVTF